jgi:hypothetical protein
MRKGIFVLSDITWFFVFVVFAALAFFILFKPLHENLEKKADITHASRADDLARMQVSADYIATALPRLQAGTRPASELMQDLARKRQELSKEEFEQSDEYKEYQAFIDSVFVENAVGATLKHGILIEQGGTRIVCNDYPKPYSPVCNAENTIEDKDSGVQVPQVREAIRIPGDGNTPPIMVPINDADIGVAFIPAEGGPITVTVVMFT